MDAVEDGHAGPESEVLGLGRDDAVSPAVPARTHEERAEDRAVHKMGGKPGGSPPLAPREEGAEEA